MLKGLSPALYFFSEHNGPGVSEQLSDMEAGPLIHALPIQTVHRGDDGLI